MMSTVFSNWHFMRWLRLAFGIIIGVEAIQMHDYLSGGIAAFFLFQAITNTGCCGETCAPVLKNKQTTNTTEVEFEEVKSK